VILKVPGDCDCDVSDANGVPLKYVVWCDAETGEAVHITQPLESTVDEDGEAGLRKEWRQHPAPLKFSRRR
jgi:hypothetical protein